MKSMKRIYLDYAATTPVDPRVLKVMRPFFGIKFGNPGSLHSFGQEAIAAVDRARETVADVIGAGFREVIFTGSATEANNLAIRGALANWRGTEPPRIIVSAIEHESVLETARACGRSGAEVILIPVNRRGLVDLGKIKESLNERTVLVSIMYANNEIGTIQPMASIAKLIREYRGVVARGAKNTVAYPLLHTDAVQAFSFLHCEVASLGVDLMTLSSHKIYGPKGVAMLYVGQSAQERRGGGGHAALGSLIAGGGQEYGLRSGTENVPAIVGFAKAVELAVAVRSKESKRIVALRTELFHRIRKNFPEAKLNGPAKGVYDTAFLPNILNVYFPGRAAQDMLTRLDRAGIAASSGSACHSRASGSSYVLEALGEKQRAASSIRFSLGRGTTKAEIAAAAKAMHLF
jgi:cysteine desulfurase